LKQYYNRIQFNATKNGPAAGACTATSLPHDSRCDAMCNQSVEISKLSIAAKNTRSSEHVLQHPTDKGLPVKSVDGATSAPVPVAIHMPRFGGRIPPVVEREPEPQPRQMKLMRVYYEEHGCTKGCKGCAALRRKGWRQPHSAACRTHMETVLAATTSGVFRLRQHDDIISAATGGAASTPHVPPRSGLHARRPSPIALLDDGGAPEVPEA
jgi:hypothetical protein